MPSYLLGWLDVFLSNGYIVLCNLHLPLELEAIFFSRVGFMTHIALVLVAYRDALSWVGWISLVVN